MKQLNMKEAYIGRGMLLYCRDDIAYRLIDTNSQFAEFFIKLFNGSLIHGSVYLSPNSTLENNNMLNEIIKEESSKNFMIDMNFPKIDGVELVH